MPKNKVAVITGGAGVLGREMALSLANSGTRVAVLDLNVDQANQVAEEIAISGGTSLGLECDVLDKSSLENSRDKIEDIWGSCDILINGAGGNHPKGTTSQPFASVNDLENDSDLISFFDLDTKGMEFVFNLNLIGTLVPSQVFSRGMVEKGSGAIVNISSMNAFRPLTKIPAYSAAKSAVSNLTQWMAVHFAKTGIRVNAIAPGFFETAQNKSLLRNEDGTLTERGQQILDHTPMQRFGKPEDLNSTLNWLCDPTSGFVTGIIVPVDGGFNAYSGV